ncbi:hypothetical protein NST99_08385 [Paenibacillus sp. FSL L8-0470]|uniref:hypothetical protein n=1 Tax=unclassified Paenibacillus TaxID=185978 RepID=UPI0030FC152F
MNDRGIGLDAAADSWKAMIEASLEQGTKVILLTPTWDRSYGTGNEAGIPCWSTPGRSGSSLKNTRSD